MLSKHKINSNINKTAQQQLFENQLKKTSLEPT